MVTLAREKIIDPNIQFIAQSIRKCFCSTQNLSIDFMFQIASPKFFFQKLDLFLINFRLSRDFLSLS